MRDASNAYGSNHVGLRYFNVAGADPKGPAGQSTKAATHLIKVAVEAALGYRADVAVFGTDYPIRMALAFGTTSMSAIFVVPIWSGALSARWPSITYAELGLRPWFFGAGSAGHG